MKDGGVPHDKLREGRMYLLCNAHWEVNNGVKIQEKEDQKCSSKNTSPSQMKSKALRTDRQVRWGGI